MDRISLFLATGAFAGVLSLGAPSSAQEAPVRGLPVDRASTYTYRFDDDPLVLPAQEDIPMVRVVPRATRQTVLRPRASFIVPLIRSIETVGDPHPAPIRVRLRAAGVH